MVRYMLCVTLPVMITGMLGEVGRHNGWWWPNSWLWWRHNKEIRIILPFCAENSLVTGEFPSQRPLAWSSDVLFDLPLNQQLSKHWNRRWFETSSRSALIMTSGRMGKDAYLVSHQSTEKWLQIKCVHVFQNAFTTITVTIRTMYVNNLAFATLLPVAIASLISRKKYDNAM